jgi:hypothetical protein
MCVHPRSGSRAGGVGAAFVLRKNMHSLRRHPDLTDLSGIGCAPSRRKNTALTDAPSYLIPRGDIQEARISRAKCTHRSKGTSSTQGASSFVLCPSPWSAVPRSLKPHGLHPPRPFATGCQAASGQVPPWASLPFVLETTPLQGQKAANFGGLLRRSFCSLQRRHQLHGIFSTTRVLHVQLP